MSIARSNHRSLILWGSLAAMLMALSVWHYFGLINAKKMAVQTVEDLVACRHLASRIQSLSQQPVRAGTQEFRFKELISQIEKAAQTAVISPDSLVRIWPEPARRIGDTPYQQKPTQILLRQVSLEQVVKLLHSLAFSDLGLRVDAIRLTSPRGEETGNTWTVEATLTYHIYVPKNGKGAV